MSRYTEAQFVDRGYMIVEHLDVLAPANPVNYVRVEDTIYNAEQLFQLITCRQLGNMGPLRSRRRNRYTYKASLLFRETRVDQSDKYYAPRHCVTHRNLARQAIFRQLYQQRSRFQEALDQVGPATEFWFTKQFHTADYLWTMAERKAKLLQRDLDFPGKNLLGRDLYVAFKKLRENADESINLADWLGNHKTPAEAPRFFWFALGDSILKHLAWG